MNISIGLRQAIRFEPVRLIFVNANGIEEWLDANRLRRIGTRDIC